MKNLHLKILNHGFGMTYRCGKNNLQAVKEVNIPAISIKDKLTVHDEKTSM